MSYCRTDSNSEYWSSEVDIVAGVTGQGLETYPKRRGCDVVWQVMSHFRPQAGADAKLNNNPECEAGADHDDRHADARTSPKLLLTLAVTLAFCLFLTACDDPEPGTVLDEAMEKGRAGTSFPAADEDYFRDMDYGFQLAGDESLSEDEVKGRNMWLVWTGGNDRFWDYMANNTFGAFDLLKILSSYPRIGYCDYDDYYRYDEHSEIRDGRPDDCVAPDPNNAAAGSTDFRALSRDNRWYWYGLVNEPGFKKYQPPTGCNWMEESCGRKEKWGLWLDVRNPDAPPDPFANAGKYEGVPIGARGTKISPDVREQHGIDAETFETGSFYGEPTGVVGLRLFPNPDFNEAAQKHWDPVKYYNDPEYYQDKDLVRPYRVGMSCAFCHVGPNPSNAPADPENPRWENLNSNPGAQYFWVDRVFIWDPSFARNNFIFQVFHTSLPGSLDTSFVSTDYINNPRTMNAVYSVLERLKIAAKSGRATLTEGSLDNKQFNQFSEDELEPYGPFVRQLFERPDTVYTPRVLKDGSDSVGVLGALNRVYLNIGLFSEEWLLHFRELTGGKPITPIRIADARKNSGYWQATEQQTLYMAKFFVKTAQPDKLEDAPGGEAYLTKDQSKLDRGKIVFAENCARCHSSKQPKICRPGEPCGQDEVVINTAPYFEKMRELVMQPEFFKDNFLSTERRITVTEIGTNICSPLATNALRGDIWDNFSSETYKNLPSVGTVTLYNPVDGTAFDFTLPGEGLGYTRPASLISLWSSAPYLLNNSVGKFYNDPSVAGRMKAFEDGIGKMLWPERRDRDPELGHIIPGPSKILRTTERSYLSVPGGYLPDLAFGMTLRRWITKIAPIFGDQGIRIGPIPKGTPVSLLTNIELVPQSGRKIDRLGRGVELVKLVKSAVGDLRDLRDLAEDHDDITREQLKAQFAPLVPKFLAISKCPDFIVNKGHYFGSNLPDQDKEALIELLKTF